jgi:hypothetical protein
MLSGMSMCSRNGIVSPVENVKGLLSRETSNKELYIDIIVSEFKMGF